MSRPFVVVGAGQRARGSPTRPPARSPLGKPASGHLSEGIRPMLSREEEARKILAQHDLLFCYEMLTDDDTRDMLINLALGSAPDFDPLVHPGNDTVH
jgi:hypothetical protein